MRCWPHARSDPQRAAALTAKATAALMAADHQAGIAAAVQAAELARGFDSPWPGFEAARLHAVGLAQAGRAVEALAVIEPYRARGRTRRRPPSSAAASGPTTPMC